MSNAASNPQNTLNLEMYGAGEIARLYGGVPKLKAAEEAILGRLAPEIRGELILDVGVGGGRTTPHLLALSQDYVGIDYAAEMIALCREKYPGVRFQQCDARHMEELGREKYGFIFFSFNGIDSIDHPGRLQVLAQVWTLLRPGGLFLFSSHNLRVRPERPWEPRVYDWSGRPRVIAYNLLCMLRNTRNFLAHVRTQFLGDGYAVLIDSLHDFRMMNYYVDPAEQLRQLSAQGFCDVEIFDQHGAACAVDAPELGANIHVHYLARKPAA